MNEKTKLDSTKNEIKH